VIASRVATRIFSTAPITIYFADTGLGIAFSGATVPMLSQDWRLAWVLLSAAAGLATLVSWTAARTDEDMHTASAGRARMHPLRRTAVAYLLFSAGYISYITFLSVYLADQHASGTQVVLTGTSLGLAVVAAPAVWRGPMTNWPGTRTLAVVLGVLGGSAALALLAPTPPIIVASAIVYGATFMSVPAGIAALIRDNTPPADWTATLAAFTTLFALGQTAGPGSPACSPTAPQPTPLWYGPLHSATVAAVIAATERTGAPIAGSFGSSSSGGCPGATTHANLGERGSELPTPPALGASYARLLAWTACEEPPVRGVVKPPSGGAGCCSSTNGL